MCAQNEVKSDHECEPRKRKRQHMQMAFKLCPETVDELRGLGGLVVSLAAPSHEISCRPPSVVFAWPVESAHQPPTPRYPMVDIVVSPRNAFSAYQCFVVMPRRSKMIRAVALCQRPFSAVERLTRLPESQQVDEIAGVLSRLKQTNK